MKDRIGDKFQQETKYHPERMSGGSLDWNSKPPLYKVYADSEKAALPEPGKCKAALDDVLRTRHSVRDYSNEPMSQQELSYLLWASTGIQRIEHGYEFRTAPSAGALYPIETYLVVNNVEGLEPGLYHYNIRSHALEVMRLDDLRLQIAAAALGQGMCAECGVVFVWTAVFQRMKWKYGQRAYRYIYLDAGHIAQNLALAAAGLGLGTCQIGALYDDEVNAIIGVDGEDESVIYMSAVGRPARLES